jgi:hypothetical protein
VTLIWRYGELAQVTPHVNVIINVILVTHEDGASKLDSTNSVKASNP